MLGVLVTYLCDPVIVQKDYLRDWICHENRGVRGDNELRFLQNKLVNSSQEESL